MKNVLDFLSYCWSSWELWQKAIILSLILNVSSIFMPSPWGLYMTYVGWSIIGIVVIKDIWFAMVREKWAKYKTHRNQLLTTIRDSDNERTR
jgi:hypothetical protein